MIGSKQEMIMTAFGIVSWLLIALIVIHKIVLSALKAKHQRQFMWLKSHGFTSDGNKFQIVPFRLILCATIYMVLIVQFWSFFRLRQFQSSMTEAAGGKFPDGQWTFGQIVAVVVFLPVAAEALYQWKFRE